MLNRRLHRDKWQQFFDNMTKALQRDEVHLYVMLRVSSVVGSHEVAPWLEFQHISYDPEMDVLNVQLDDFSYHIESPVQIWAAIENDRRVEQLVVIRHDGTRDYIEFSTIHYAHDSVAHHTRTKSRNPAKSGVAQ